jgi:hypothetical protein
MVTGSVRTRRLLLVAVVLLGACVAGMAQADGFDRGERGFSISAQGVSFRYRVFTLPLMPGETVTFQASQAVRFDQGEGWSDGTSRVWQWTAPAAPSAHVVRFAAGDQDITVNLLVMRPASEMRGDSLGHYRIGQYASKPLRGLPAYLPPKGFIEVTPELSDLPVSPHFTLGQFLCKQASDWPKYLLLRPQLLLKLELILDLVNQHGIRTDRLDIMSGYRTPWYNREIGNRTTSSRHLYGGAADIFIDVDPQDGVMDDLNGDGKISKADAWYLADLIEGWSWTSVWRGHVGGLSAYGKTASHGPFVHVDARGQRARWGR